MISANFSVFSMRPVSLSRSVPRVAWARGNAPFSRLLRPQIGRHRRFFVRSAVIASPSPAAPPADGPPQEQEDHMVAAVPAHWRAHMARLRVGERKTLNRYLPIVTKINELEPEMEALSDSELAAKTEALRSRATAGESQFQLLPEAFAVVREAASRVLGMRHYDVQLLGGIVLAEGKVAEMGTGEGKTLVAALPAYLKALTGRGVHVVTVNDYLAQRDASWIGKVLSFLGLSVGAVVNATPPHQRTMEFAKDVTYVTAYELAFTFLQDNLAPTAQAISMRRPFHYAIVDEVDSVLIDEARTPFIINGPDDSLHAEDLWTTAVEVADRLDELTDEYYVENFPQGPPSTEDIEDLPFDFLPDRRLKKAVLTQQGMRRSVQALAALGKVIMARDESPRASSTTATTPPLVAVLLFDAPDGGIEMRVRSTLPSHDGPAGVLTGVAATDTESSDDVRWPPKKVGSREEVAAALRDGSKWNLVPEPASPRRGVTRQEWQAAASAVLWSGGERAWGRFLVQAITATHLFQVDVDYIVKAGEVVIVDTTSGREKIGSRWQDGLHQALEAKEAKRIKEALTEVLAAKSALAEVTIKRLEAEKKFVEADELKTAMKDFANKTARDVEAQVPKVKPEFYDRGRITYQALFAGYPQLAGMTGTASTEIEELTQFYGLDVVRVPPHRPSRRVDHKPAIYMSKYGWEMRLLEVVRKAAAEGRPVLLGTSSVEESEEVRSLLATMTFQVELSDGEVARLRAALDALPPTLHLPVMADLTPDSDLSWMSQRGQHDVLDRWYYNVPYRQAIRMLYSVVRERRIIPYSAKEADDAVSTLQVVLLHSKILLTEAERANLEAVVHAVERPFNRSQLGNWLPINLLNARPDEVRREAETIAQAGLPGTITVATAMAGRGTDILLGGNPKGLTQMALQRFILPLLAPTADDLREWTPSRQSLGGFGVEFSSEGDMRLHLPAPVFRAFQSAVAAVREAAGAAENELDGRQPGSKRAPPSPAGDSQRVRRHEIAEHAAAALREVLEGVEMDRSVFLMKMRRQQQQDSSLESTLEGALKWMEAEEPEGTRWGDGMGAAERAVRRYALLQWLWFDARCTEYAEVVRGAGGLVAVITSLQPSRRTELQIRGRAGRQGDAGETYLLSSREDSIIRNVFGPLEAGALWDFASKQLGPDEEMPPFSVMPGVNKIIDSAEKVGLEARTSTRKFDIVIDPLRRHVFRLRRVIAAGGDAARAALAHRYLRQLAADMVTQHAHPAASPATWNLQGLLQDVEELFKDPFLPESSDSGGAPRTSAAISAAGCSVRLSKGSRGTSNYMLDVQLAPDATARTLREALLGNDMLVPAETVLGGRGGAAPLRRRAVLQMVRKELGGSAEQLALPQRKGRYARQAARLDLWLGDLLAVLYEHKRGAIATAFHTSMLTSASPSGSLLHVASALRLWERDTALQCLDELWSDFLQDAASLQNAVVSRSFAQLDPIDEFRLEAAQAFARLLADLYRQTAVALLGPVDEWQLHTHSMAGDAMLSQADADSVGDWAPLGRVLAQDADWAAEWVKRGEPAAATGELKGDVDPDVWGALGHSKDELRAVMGMLGGDVERGFELLAKSLEEGAKTKSPEEMKAALADFAASRRAEERAEGGGGEQPQQTQR